MEGRVLSALRGAVTLVDFEWTPPPDHEVLSRDTESAIVSAARLVQERLHATPRPAGGRLVALADLLIELTDLSHALVVERFAERVGAVNDVREALARLRNAAGVEQLIERAAADVCRGCHFDRAVFFRVDPAGLVARSAHFEGDAAWAQRFLAEARARPVMLRPVMAEAELLRRRRAKVVTVSSAEGPLCALAHAARTSSYVAAPIVCEQQVVGLLHVDRFFARREVDPLDRDTVWAFAEGFGYMLERATLNDRLRAQRESILRAISAEDPGAAVQPLGPSAPDDELAMPADPFALPALADPAATPLTRRELEVLGLIGRGATNQQIADTLVISEETVKSHVKNILRKLGVSNRTQAAGRLGPAAVR